jgi:hypothetical protein
MGVDSPSSFFYKSVLPKVAQVAQSVEQGIENPCVGGSIPSLGTISNMDAMLLTLTIIVLASGVVIALAGVFFKSEQDAAEPVEPPTREDLKEGNLSPDIPVAEEENGRQ